MSARNAANMGQEACAISWCTPGSKGVDGALTRAIMRNAHTESPVTYKHAVVFGPSSGEPTPREPLRTIPGRMYMHIGSKAAQYALQGDVDGVDSTVRYRRHSIEKNRTIATGAASGHRRYRITTPA